MVCRPGVVSAVTVVTGPSSGPHLTDLLEDNSWKPHLADEYQKPYFLKLEKFIKHEWATQMVFPPSSQIFRWCICKTNMYPNASGSATSDLFVVGLHVRVCRAFNTCPFDDVKVVILGQDPYHNDKQAMGTSGSRDSNRNAMACLILCCCCRSEFFCPSWPAGSI